MKSSLKKLRGLAAHHHHPGHNHKGDPKEKRGRHINHRPAQLGELEQASQDMQDMRNCYDSLISAAAATANSAFEFSEALREMGNVLLERTALNDDEESGRVLLMLGKVQFELQKLVDNYRSHIVQTIQTPSESLLNELRTVEDMKQQCDEKRKLFEDMLASQKEKGKSRISKGETSSHQQLQAAQEEYDEEATLFVFRLKSLKQGQSRSLLTQAARHHAAQLSFFRKGSRSLEAVEPHVKLVAEQQHIDYNFSGLEDDATEDDEDDEYHYSGNTDGELSFDYGQNDHSQEVVSTSRHSMELDQTDHSSAPVLAMETAKENMEKAQPDLLSFHREFRPGSQSAPLLPDRKFDPAEKLKEMRPSSTRKFHTYVLPTPTDCRSTSLTSSAASRDTRLGGWPTQLWHSSPLGLEKDAIHMRVDSQPEPHRSLKSLSVPKESNTSSDAGRAPPPLTEGFSLPHLHSHTGSDNKKIKRQAFSGPLASRPFASRPLSTGPASESSSMPTVTLRVPGRHSTTSPKLSPNASPQPISSPKISELHELPRPPLTSAKPTRPPSLVGHSAPLVFRVPEHSSIGSRASVSSHTASPLPMPPSTITMTRSYSIPSRTSSTVSKLLESQNADVTQEITTSLTVAASKSKGTSKVTQLDDEVAK